MFLVFKFKDFSCPNKGTITDQNSFFYLNDLLAIQIIKKFFLDF